MNSLRSIEVPRGAIFVLCALVLALPAGFAGGHELRYSGGQWTHQHTREYRTCNGIDQDSQLKTKANEARADWGQLYTETGVTVPYAADCHPGAPPGAANIELMDAYFGQTGWRVSAFDTSTNNWTAGYHSTHTHVQFNLTHFGTQVTQYHKRTMACREIGRAMGLKLASGRWPAARSAGRWA